MLTKLEITKNWLPRYTRMPLERFGDYILLTNFAKYIQQFASQDEPFHQKLHDMTCIGIEAMTELGMKGEKIKHFRY